MTAEQKQALDWAINQRHQSVAARYARTLAMLVKEQEIVIEELQKHLNDPERPAKGEGPANGDHNK